ncbi:MAG: SoxR reducing system RseC family protein [Paludibacteraceae bacterium]|jgi:sigma-E factor negative regulatory protein RseC|nr:SoxR reducing system RseC family protein [Paludibacteraceae bacterium]
MIKHDGIVIAVNGDGTVRVRIVQTSACASCKAKAMCASAESVEKEIDAVSDGLLAIGDEAEVLVAEKIGWKAIFLAYILPFVVLLGSVLVLNEFMKEELAGTIALCAMGVYYIVLGFFKNKIQKGFSFTARKK